jgi:hypothetical protein
VKPYKPRRTAKQHDGRINLYAIVPFPTLFMDRSGHFWSTSRPGLRQRKVGIFKGFPVLSVSWRGQVANWTAGALAMLARGHNWKVHWDGTQIRPDWLPDEACGPGGEGLSAKVVDDAPRNV